MILDQCLNEEVVSCRFDFLLVINDLDLAAIHCIHVKLDGAQSILVGQSGVLGLWESLSERRCGVEVYLVAIANHALVHKQGLLQT